MDWKIERLKSYLVYGIVDPDTGKYVYIGSTTSRLWDRRAGHSTGHGNRPLSSWLAMQRQNNKKVDFVCIRECDKEIKDLLFWEYFYIKKFRNDGHPLFNITMRDISYPKTKTIIYEQ